MKYRCLVLDHDDTVVNSTASVHFPCFAEFLRRFFPEAYAHGYTLEEYYVKNFDPGIISLFRDEIGMSEAELLAEQEFWARWVRDRVPAAYPEFRSILRKHRERGGLICVSSHSLKENILRDYRENDLPEPDLIFGWDLPPADRKPSPYALQAICDAFGLRKSDLLMIDDLKPGYDMARRFGCDFAAAGWAFDVPQVSRFMRANCDYYFQTAADLEQFLDE